MRILDLLDKVLEYQAKWGRLDLGQRVVGEIDFGQVRLYGRATFSRTTSESDAMHMIVPPVKERRMINRLLLAFFREHRVSNFNRAMVRLCRFYRLKRPQVEWFEYLDWGRTAGRTYENGKIHLVHPENWKRGRKYNSERQWVNAVYHEMGHYIFWTDAERKADTFALRMERNVSRVPAAVGTRTRLVRKAA